MSTDKAILSGKNQAAVELGSRGGKARAKSLKARRRKEIASKAAKARWARVKREEVREELPSL